MMMWLSIAKAAGFSLSADDLKNAQSEVSEEELEGVAGGGESVAPCTFWRCCFWTL